MIRKKNYYAQSHIRLRDCIVFMYNIMMDIHLEFEFLFKNFHYNGQPTVQPNLYSTGFFSYLYHF